MDDIISESEQNLCVAVIQFYCLSLRILVFWGQAISTSISTGHLNLDASADHALPPVPSLCD
jgi:hypothetical protein